MLSWKALLPMRIDAGLGDDVRKNDAPRYYKSKNIPMFGMGLVFTNFTKITRILRTYIYISC